MASVIGRYLKETRRPVYSAALVLPFFLIYHTGTLFLKTTYVNGADALITQLLSLLSVRSALASAVVLLLCFIAWQVRTRAPWKIEAPKLAALFAESCLFAFLLFALLGWLGTHLSPAAAGARSPGMIERLILYCGAGIYEELVFRLILICVLMFVFQDLFALNHTSAIVVSVLLSAALFSAHHHYFFVGGHFEQSELFQWSTFIFRTTAGVYFAVLYAIRGFGITAGTHALYDIIVTVMNVYFFHA